MPDTKSYEDWRQEQLQDAEFREAVEELEPAFQVTCLRIERGMTQKDLADAIGTKQSSIARLENGSTPPSLSFLRRIAKALDARLELQIIPSEELSQMNNFFATPNASSSCTDASSTNDPKRSYKSNYSYADSEAVGL